MVLLTSIAAKIVHLALNQFVFNRLQAWRRR